MNSEFRRYVWLELTPTRTATMAVVLSLVFFLAAKLFYDSLLPTALVILGWSILMGTKRCFDAVTSEVHDNTWDFQRMSSAKPWQLTVGKLFGAPLYYSIVGMVALGVAAFASLLYTRSNTEDIARLSVWAVSAMIFFHASALLLSLDLTASIRQQRRTKRSQIILTILLVAIAPLLINLVRVLPSLTSGITWWGIKFRTLDFIILSTTAFMLWSIVGSYRLMRRELQYRSAPWVWSLFLLFAWLWLVPLLSVLRPLIFMALGDVGDIILPFTGLLLSWACVQLFLVVEQVDVVRVRKFWEALITGDIRAAAFLTPRWGATLLVMCLAAILALATLSSIPMKAMAVAACAFAARDCLAIIACTFLAPHNPRMSGMTMVYFSLMYGVIPAIAGKIFGPSGWATFIIFTPDTAVISLVAAAAGLIVAGGVVAAVVRGPGE